MKRLPWGLILGLVCAGGIWLHFHDVSVRQTALLSLRDDSLKAVSSRLDAAEHARADADEHARRTIQVLQDSIDWQQLRRDSLQAVFTVDLMELRASLPPGQRIYVDNLDRNQKALTAASEAVIAALTVQRDSALTGWARADSAAGAEKALREKWEGEALAWRKRAAPGLLEQARRGLPWLAAGLLLGLILR